MEADDDLPEHAQRIARLLIPRLGNYLAEAGTSILPLDEVRDRTPILSKVDSVEVKYDAETDKLTLIGCVEISIGGEPDPALEEWDFLK